MDLLLFTLRVATLRPEPRSHCLFWKGLHGKPGNEVGLIHSA